jgi:hypothetical protein
MYNKQEPTVDWARKQEDGMRTPSFDPSDFDHAL